ncbi:MAG: preprotein translocase subunit SecG [Patescibacteria group bacterium]|nr:preprotein translocase subunit SecG [Patescibacteria group bacterium]MDE2438202.1 preprotein translocase subunit SecG [Patescibacteria group bacterium]
MSWITITQIILSVLIVTAILLQPRGMGLGSAFGGDSTLYYTRRGLERVLYLATIVLIVLFGILSLIGLRFS